MSDRIQGMNRSALIGELTDMENKHEYEKVTYSLLELVSFLSVSFLNWLNGRRDGQSGRLITISSLNKSIFRDRFRIVRIDFFSGLFETYRFSGGQDF